MPTIELVLWIVASYLWGGIPTAFLVARARLGIDLRRYGTGTIGGANAGEQMGKVWTFVIGGVDFVKGIAPAALARALDVDPATTVLASVATVAGHNWSPYLGGLGGRGLAASVGVLVAWDARLALFLLAFFYGFQAIRLRAPAPVLGFLSLTPFAWWLGLDIAHVAGCGLLAALAVLKRLEANRLPLPAGSRERARVLWRRFWLDRDVPLGQPWEERKRFR
jgi:glycerol-3-phosphate acyltransferase PlsY